MTEYSKYWGEHQDLLLAPNFIKSTCTAEPKTSDHSEETVLDDDEQSEEKIHIERIIAVTKWFISTLKSQYCSRNESMGYEKKPLNPFLGELFIGKWKDDTENSKLGDSILISEQVSHHPPETAYSIINDKNKTVLQGYNGIRASISMTTMSVRQFGHAILSFENLGEKYLITLPPLHIEGILSGSPFVELDGNSYIQSSTGFVSIINYAGKGFFSGKKHSFKATITKSGPFSRIHDQNLIDPLYTIKGQWSDISYIKSGDSKDSKEEIFYDANNPAHHLIVKPIDQQHHLESRKAWLKVSAAIETGNYDLIHQEKSKIEQEQREMRKEEDKNSITWQQRFFNSETLYSNSDDDQQYNEDKHGFVKLSDMLDLSVKNVTSGTMKGDEKNPPKDVRHWRFDREKWDDETIIKP